MKSINFFLVILIILLSSNSHAEGEKWVIANISWNFGPGNDRTFTGYGATKTDAFADAQRTCVRTTHIESEKFFCYNSPVAQQYSEKGSCGQAWTGWITIGHAVGDPCPENCTRGPEIDTKTRIVDLGKIQIKHKFQCWLK